jgi:hypothetical protein
MLAWCARHLLLPVLPLSIVYAVDLGQISGLQRDWFSFISLLWWGFGIGIFGIIDMLWLIETDWKRELVKWGIGSMGAALYVVATLHSLLLFCGTQVSVSENSMIWGVCIFVTFLGFVSRLTRVLKSASQVGS